MNLKKFLKKGSGEAISFIVLAPLIVGIIAIVIHLILLMSLKQRLEYTTYVACRAAVVSDKMEDAKKNAQLAAEQDLSSYSAFIKAGSIHADIGYAGKAKSVKQKKRNGTTKSSQWARGNYLTCTVSFEPSENLFKGLKKQEFTIVMAIEKPDDYI